MKIKKTLKSVFKWGLAAYLTAYAGLSAHVFYDYFKYNQKRVEQNKDVALEAHSYNINIDGKEKYLTLVGERHCYNKAEHEIGEKLVKQHKCFADECGGPDGVKDISIGNFLYGLAIALPITIEGSYSNLGNGRIYISISDIAREKGHKIYPLENPNDAFNNMSFKERASLLLEADATILIAPRSYYFAKNEKPSDAKDYKDFKYREALIDKRDPVMAQGVVNLLKKEGVDSLLATVGKAHLEGVIKNLSQKVEIREIK